MDSEILIALAIPMGFAVTVAALMSRRGRLLWAWFLVTWGWLAVGAMLGPKLGELLRMRIEHDATLGMAAGALLAAVFAFLHPALCARCGKGRCACELTPRPEA